MLKDQLFKTSGLQFDYLLFGPEKLSGLSEKQTPVPSWPERMTKGLTLETSASLTSASLSLHGANLTLFNLSDTKIF